MMEQLGRMIVLAGIILVAVGVVLSFADRVPFIGRLPGDIHIRRGNFQIYFPVATSIALSVLLSLLFVIVSKFLRR